MGGTRTLATIIGFLGESGKEHVVLNVWLESIQSQYRSSRTTQFFPRYQITDVPNQLHGFKSSLK